MNTNDYITLLRRFLSEYGSEYGILRLGIFGSVARGDQTERSDVDIYYVGAPLGIKSLIGLPHALENYLGTSVDVVREHEGLNPAFRRRITKEVIYV